MAGLFSSSRRLRRATVSLRFSECLKISHREPTGAECRIRWFLFRYWHGGLCGLRVDLSCRLHGKRQSGQDRRSHRIS